MMLEGICYLGRLDVAHGSNILDICSLEDVGTVLQRDSDRPATADVRHAILDHKDMSSICAAKFELTASFLANTRIISR